jgi:hypothetical protein
MCFLVCHAAAELALVVARVREILVGSVALDVGLCSIRAGVETPVEGRSVVAYDTRRRHDLFCLVAGWSPDDANETGLGRFVPYLDTAGLPVRSRSSAGVQARAIGNPLAAGKAPKR